MNIVEILQLKFPTASLLSDIILQDDGSGPYIKEWNLDSPKPSDDQLAQWKIDLSLDYQVMLVRQTRQENYPSIEVQLDMQYHDAINGTTTWVDMIQSIKLQYPLPKGANEEI